MSIDNFKLIYPFLEFKNKGDFFVLHLFTRRKDFGEVNNNHQSVRTIKVYTIYSLEYLQRKEEEIKGLCEFFKARAYINLNRMNDFTVITQMLKELANRMESGNNDCSNLYNSVVGNLPIKGDKRWIVDIDKDELRYKDDVIKYINMVKPEGNKILLEVPTKSGIHLITSPFDTLAFKEICKKGNLELSIQKCNPTLIFVPNSLIKNSQS